MWQSREVFFPADHLTAAGHFPGNPIIPGAVLLDEVLSAIAGGGFVGDAVLRAAKFLAPVRPGGSILIRWEADARGQARFECRTLDLAELLVVGTLRLEATAS